MMKLGHGESLGSHSMRGCFSEDLYTLHNTAEDNNGVERARERAKLILCKKPILTTVMPIFETRALTI